MSKYHYEFGKFGLIEAIHWLAGAEKYFKDNRDKKTFKITMFAIITENGWAVEHTKNIVLRKHHTIQDILKHTDTKRI